MDAFLGSICQFGFNFAPYQWAQCNGAILPISRYAALFSLLGTAYGGNGTTTFALPNLGGNVAISQGSNGQSTYNMGEMGGSGTVTMLSSNMPAHSHSVSFALKANNAAKDGTSPSGTFPGLGSSKPYASAGSGVFMANPTVTLGATGGAGTPIAITDPNLVLNYCIALSGTFPQRS